MLPPETILVAGPTGAGKSALSLLLAERLGGEIVGADAFQIYRGLPLLTAQPPPASRRGIPHHLIGCVDPSEHHDAARWLAAVREILPGIVARGRRPVVVGGTGLFFKALLGGLQEMPPGDPSLRAELELLPDAELARLLSSLDSRAPAQVDMANRRRVVRAVEIVRLTGRPLAESRTAARPMPPPGVRALLVTRDREDLGRRILGNVRAMFSAGVEQEVASLPLERTGPTAAATLGLREIRSLLAGEISRGECIDAVTLATRRYAKRQMTWFRNQHDFNPLHLSGGDIGEAADNILRSPGF